mgnify:CR=1 FL=1
MRLVGQALLIGDVIAHRVALDDVAIVDQDRVAGFGADGVDDRRSARQAQRVVGRIGVVIVREHRDMQVGGFHQAQVRLAGGGLYGEGVQHHGGAQRRRAGEEGTAGNRVIVVH